jgi:hypothetical protein
MKILHAFRIPPACVTCPAHITLIHMVTLIFVEACKSSLLYLKLNWTLSLFSKAACRNELLPYLTLF